MHNFTLKIKTLSPVHIGDGLVYNGMTSFEHHKSFVPFDSRTLIPAFNKAGIDFKKFVKWIEDTKFEREYSKPRIGQFIRDKYPNKADQMLNVLESLGSKKLENLCLARIFSDISTCLKNI